MGPSPSLLCANALRMKVIFWNQLIFTAATEHHQNVTSCCAAAVLSPAATFSLFVLRCMPFCVLLFRTVASG
uniref:Uncharacterized protein n=1 Tax=Anguilla anguilla TaxID=7936 RepID=A0A0E9SRU8_ANGAN